MRIFFLNHTGSFSGAENAMLRLLDSLPGEHERLVGCPAEGRLRGVVRERGVAQVDLPGTELSLRLHPVETPRGLAELLRAAGAVRKQARRFGADVVHANSVRAGLIAALAHRAGGPPVVVQCHDNLPDSPAANLTRRVLDRWAEEVVAVTRCTAERFNRGLARPKATHVYISVDHERFSPAARGVSSIRDELGLPSGARLLAQVAQITPWKGQDTAIKALARVRKSHDAHLLLVGETAFSSQRYDNEGFLRGLKQLARELEVEGAVHFLGQRRDVPELMGASELLLLPSWDEPFGLVVAEAMAVGTPVIVTRNGGVSEYVEEGVNGRLLDPEDAEPWAGAAIGLLNEPDTLERMGKACVETAAGFSDERYSEGMLAAYRRAAAA